MFSLHRDELIGIVRQEGKKYCYDLSTEKGGDPIIADGVHVEILKFTATNNDKTGTIEVNPIYTYCGKQLMPGIATSVKLKKYATDVLGNLYEVKENRLKLEFD